MLFLTGAALAQDEVDFGHSMGSSTPQSVVECAVHGALPDGCRKGGRCPNSKVMRLCPFNSFP